MGSGARGGPAAIEVRRRIQEANGLGRTRWACAAIAQEAQAKALAVRKRIQEANGLALTVAGPVAGQ